MRICTVFALSLLVAHAAAAQATAGDTAVRNSEPVYFEFQVEKQIRMASKSPPPRYPKALREASVEGEVLAQFIVDTTGRFEPGSFVMLRSSHQLFTDAIRDALPLMKFLPAEIGGRKVRQFVQQPFTFGIAH